MGEPEPNGRVNYLREDLLALRQEMRQGFEDLRAAFEARADKGEAVVHKRIDAVKQELHDHDEAIEDLRRWRARIIGIALGVSAISSTVLTLAWQWILAVRG